jgi:hypothetical protein
MITTRTDTRASQPRPAAWAACIALAAAASAAVAACLAATALANPSIDPQAALPVAPHGTPFHFEVIESHDAEYLGDTPAHRGKDGGLTFRPQVALGDAVYRGEGKATQVIGRVTKVAWDRVSGSLTVEFDPQPFERIAVGDEVWIDLNPRPPEPPTPGESR